jgi:hypothetical protein
MMSTSYASRQRKGAISVEIEAGGNQAAGLFYLCAHSISGVISALQEQLRCEYER